MCRIDCGIAGEKKFRQKHKEVRVFTCITAPTLSIVSSPEYIAAALYIEKKKNGRRDESNGKTVSLLTFVQLPLTQS